MDLEKALLLYVKSIGLKLLWLRRRGCFAIDVAIYDGNKYYIVKSFIKNATDEKERDKLLFDDIINKLNERIEEPIFSGIKDMPPNSRKYCVMLHVLHQMRLGIVDSSKEDLLLEKMDKVWLTLTPNEIVETERFANELRQLGQEK